MIQLFIGGVRSGKSAAAETLLNNLLTATADITPHYIATSIASDEETCERIEQHQALRQSRFKQNINSIELDYLNKDLNTTLASLNHPQHVVLIECLSTWVGWYLTQDLPLQENLALFKEKQNELLSFLLTCRCQVIIVTGEVGCGLIGESRLQRKYADALGELNQQVANIADNVFLLTAGIKQQIKP